MKTAVSVPDNLFEEADELATRLHTSRSHVFSEALREYLDRHNPERVTEAMNAVVEEVGDDVDDFVGVAALSTLRDSQW